MFRSILLSLCLALFAPAAFAAYDPCAANDTGKASVVINISTATTTQLVALSSGKTVYVCSLSLTISQVVTTPNTLKLVYGTGSSCGTGTTALTGLYGDGGITAGIPIVINVGNGGTITQGAVSAAICATTAIGGSGTFQGLLTYVQS